MNREQLIAYHQECTTKMLAICRAKNSDYAGAGGNSPFANFQRVEHLGVCRTEQGFLVRMTDKLSRLASFCESGTLQVKDESVEDTLLDLANYCILMAAYLQSVKGPA